MPDKYDVEIKWFSPKLAQVQFEVNGEPIRLSRLQIGVLFLFTLLPELERKEIYQYLAGIWLSGEPLPKPIPTQYRNGMSRIINRLLEQGLIIEHDKRYYQTKKGRVMYMTMEHHLQNELATLAGIYGGNKANGTNKPR